MIEKVQHACIYLFLLATDKAKVVRELTQHVRETTSEVSKQDIGEGDSWAKVELRPPGLLVFTCPYTGSKYRYRNKKEGHKHHYYNSLIFGLSFDVLR